ncbi:hypothetical protein RJ639_021656 [Escallonia herrerae]|uniref:Uncharacterized protein n=1 Tax=Escallonia herrerae TaxID=1293975 RepID=A0AA88V4N5_9ASTE|nr:hypothetical protein RJ639_021656 [Escallonia herrerae]
MADRFFPNQMPDFIPETSSEAPVTQPAGDSLTKLLHLPYKSVSEQLKRAALDLKETVVRETWGARGKRVTDYTLYTGALGTAFLLFKGYQVTKNKNDLLLCSDIVKACDSASREDMSESSVSVSSPEEDVVISSSSSSRSGRVSTSSSEVRTSNPQLLRPLSSEPLRPSSSQPPQPSTSQPSPSLPAKNALGDVKDQAEDEANPKPWYTADEKSSKMSTEDLVELLWEYPLPIGWYARLPGLQEPANYGTKNGQWKWKNAEGKRKEKQPSAELPPAPKKARVIPPDHSPQIVEKVSVKEDLIFHPRWTLRSNDVGMLDSQILEQHLVHGVLPRDKEIFQNQTHETFACSFAQAVYTMYASGSEMLSRFEMARQVAAEEARQKREALKEAEEATRRAEELNRDFGEETGTGQEARDQGIRDFLDGNAGDEWLKKRADDGLEIYELGFAKAKEMFAERFPDIPLGDFVLPAMVSPSGETIMPVDARDAAASHLPREGPSSDAPEL